MPAVAFDAEEEAPAGFSPARFYHQISFVNSALQPK